MTPAAEQLGIAVVTWNIQYGIAVDAAIEEIRSSPALSRFDVLLLQEMDEQGTRAIATALDADFAFASRRRHANTGRDFGNAVVSRRPIVERAQVDLPHAARVRGHERHATFARVDVDGRSVGCYSVHTEVPLLPLSRRREQFAHLAADIRDGSPDLVVVGGDFNTITSRGLRALDTALGEAGLRRVSSDVGPTYRRASVSMRLDHVFAAGLRSTGSGSAATTASDHPPMWVDLVTVPDH